MARSELFIPISINDEIIKQLNYSTNEKRKYNESYSSYVCVNTLIYAEEPTRLGDFRIDNDDIETAYIPQVTFNFQYIDAVVYSKLIEKVNSTGFKIKYYDTELMEVVERKMYMSEHSAETFYNVYDESIENNDDHYDYTGAVLKAQLNVSMTFVSKYGYKNYDELRTKKVSDFESE